MIDDVLAGNLALTTLGAVLVAKAVAWWIALGSGTSGGTLAPVLLIGASFGGLFASVALEIAPALGISQGAFAVVAMAAAFGAAARAPLTAIVFIFELTRDFDVMLPLMLASVLAALVFSALSSESIYTEKLSRRGIRVGGELVADSLRTTAVIDVMNRVVDTIEPTDTVGEVADRIRKPVPWRVGARGRTRDQGRRQRTGTVPRDRPARCGRGPHRGPRPSGDATRAAGQPWRQRHR